MKKILTLCLFALSFNSFALLPTDSNFVEEVENLEEILDLAENNATTDGRMVLETSRSMIRNQDIVLGSCWDYIDAVFSKAGYPSNKRRTIFKSKLPGPYVQIELIEEGDWLYFINHSYGDVEHSGIFVAWTDENQKEALMISYAGGNQAKPARYKKYILTSVYNIMRGVR